MIEKLNQLGYNIKHKTKNSLIILVPNSERHTTIHHLTQSLNGIYDSMPTSQSSLGCVIADEYKIYVKPLEKQGHGSSGKANEKFLLDKFELYAGQFNKVVFQSEENQKIVPYKYCEDISFKRSKKVRMKADINISDGVSDCFISLKQGNAEIWESADTYGGDLAKLYISHTISQNKTQLIFDQVYKIQPNIAIECNEKECNDVVFGHDVINNGFVVIRHFREDDFWLNNKSLFVQCDQIVCDISDLKPYQKPWFFIRNDSTRTCGYKGIRVLVVYESRLNENVLKIPLSDRVD